MQSWSWSEGLQEACPTKEGGRGLFVVQILVRISSKTEIQIRVVQCDVCEGGARLNKVSCTMESAAADESRAEGGEGG